MSNDNMTATKAMRMLHEQQAKYGPPPPSVKTREDYLRWVISQIHINAQREAEPFIEQLVEIEKLKPPKAMVLPPDGADDYRVAELLNKK